MKKALLLSGALITLISLLRGMNYLIDYRALDVQYQNAFYSYHQGHIIGTAIILLVGVGLMILGTRKKKHHIK